MSKVNIKIAFFSIVFVLVVLFFMGPNNMTGRGVLDEDSVQKTTLGYCPTVKSDAEKIAIENNYELKEFGSASEVLTALSNKQINYGVIGRKAESRELSDETKEVVLKSGYTLVSNKKTSMELSELKNYEIYTHISEEIFKDLLPSGAQVLSLPSKSEAIKQIKEGNIVLISWDDWQEEFGLVVVFDNNKKVKSFRGAFLYSKSIAL